MSIANLTHDTLYMPREITRLTAEVQRLKQVEQEYTELLRRSNHHNAVMARNVLEAIIRPPTRRRHGFM